MFVGLLFCIPECTHRKAGTHPFLTPGGGEERDIIVVVVVIVVIVVVEPLPPTNFTHNA